MWAPEGYTQPGHRHTEVWSSNWTLRGISSGRELGPDGSNTVWFQAIQQTSDGRYVTSGNYYPSGSPSTALVVKLDSSGNVQWQEAFNAGVSNSLFTDSMVQASDGGYVIAGAWFGSTRKGGLLVKLDSSGKVLWQNAYSGGTYRGVELGVVIYSVHQTADGGYFLAGDGEDKSRPASCWYPGWGKSIPAAICSGSIFIIRSTPRADRSASTSLHRTWQAMVATWLPVGRRTTHYSSACCM